MTPNIFSITIVVFFVTYQNVYTLTCIETKPKRLPDSMVSPKTLGARVGECTCVRVGAQARACACARVALQIQDYHLRPL